MKKIVLDDIPIEINVEDLIKKNGFAQLDATLLSDCLKMADMLKNAFQPKAIVRECRVEVVASNIVSIDGYIYKSKSLKTIFTDHHYVFPYVLTIGQTPHFKNQLDHYLASTLQFQIMIVAMKYLKEFISNRSNFSKIGIVNPGLITDWEIKNNRTIFETIGDVADRISVEITKNNIMKPAYSSSGILFEDFHSYCECDRCSIDACIARESSQTEIRQSSI